MTDSPAATSVEKESLSKRQKYVIRFAILLGSTAIAVVLLEAATRVIFDRNGMHYGIEMWKYAKFIKRRSSNSDIGHEHTPNSRHRLMGVDVSINSQGLRDREFPFEKDSGKYRILAMGDSITFGWGVPAESTFAKRLERQLNEQRSPETGLSYEVINTGVGNYNTAQQVAYFLKRGVKFDPDMVLVGFYINDAEPTPRPHSNWLMRHSYLYVLTSSGFDAFARKGDLKKSYQNYYLELYSEEAPGWQACRKALRELADYCGKNQIELVIALIPELHQPNSDYAFSSIHQRINELAGLIHVPTIDLLPAFEGFESRSLWVSPGDAHPNAKAHEIIAGSLFEQFSKILDKSKADKAH